MRKHAFFLFLFMAGIQFFASAQIFIMDLPPGHNKVISAEKEKGLDGSPWLMEDWSPGTVRLISGKIIEGLSYRYNVYRNRLYFQYENAEFVISAPDSIDQLVMAGKIFVYDNPDSLAKDKKRLMEIAVDGPARLYVNYYPFIIPANYNIALGSGNANETVSVREAYLIKVGATLTTIDKKGKNITAAFPDKKQELDAFMKKINFSVKKRSDIEKAVRYYNSLNQ